MLKVWTLTSVGHAQDCGEEGWLVAVTVGPAIGVEQAAMPIAATVRNPAPANRRTLLATMNPSRPAQKVISLIA
jgi:hypothetical protein